MNRAASFNSIELIGRLSDAEDVRHFRAIAKGAIDDALLRRDPIEILIFAEYAKHWKEWNTSAQLFLHIIVRCECSHIQVEARLEQINSYLKIINNCDPQICSTADFFLYCYKQLSENLSNDKVTKRDTKAWIRDGIIALAGNSNNESKRISNQLRTICEQFNHTSAKYADLILPFRSIVARSLGSIHRMNSRICGSIFSRGTLQLILLLGMVSLSIMLYTFVEIPFFSNSSGIIYAENQLFYKLILLWPFLLIGTWFFGLLESRRTRSFSFVSPLHFITDSKIIFGELMPFRRDWFYHIFQFFWVPYLLICIAILAKVDPLNGTIREAWNSDGHDGLTASSYLATLSGTSDQILVGNRSFYEIVIAFLINDTLTITFAAIVSLLFMANQIRIQRCRKLTDVNFYWWDWRISKPEWVVRLLMVGFDTFVGIAILLKVFAISLVALDLAARNLLKVKYFHPDSVGGLFTISAVFSNILWLVFLFGIFVMASLYLHRRLDEYKETDRILVTAYVVLMVLALMPLLLVEYRIEQARDAIFLVFGNSIHNSIPTENILRIAEGLDALKRWHVTAMDFGFLSGPILPLVSQAVIILVQYTQPIDNLGDSAFRNTFGRVRKDDKLGSE